jgi:transcriptional regulator with XRE-family HTH domain
MKLGQEAREKLSRTIRDRVAQLDDSIAEISARAHVHPSQVSRICRGQFKTVSSNLMQICTALGLELSEGETRHPVAENHLQRRLEASVLELWDRSPEDAKRLIKFLEQLAELRR